MNPLRILSLALCAAFVALVAAVPAQANLTTKFQSAVSQILAQPYEAGYVPLGYDSAFPYGGVLNTFPVQDYTSGSKAGNPDAPPWPIGFDLVSFMSLDGAPLKGHLARQPGNHPGIVVVHGFNSNGRDSAVRWAAMLARNGYNVLAFDLRGFPPEYRAGGNQPLPNPQTLGWKEAEDVVAAGRFLKAQTGVTSVGVVGWSFGGQETVLALGLEGLLPEASRVFQAGLNYSGPADQNTQIYSTAVPMGCQTPLCTFPVTGALLVLVVPPSDTTNPCTVLTRAQTRYGVDPYTIMSRTDGFQKQRVINVPLLNVYANDDPLVAPFQATMMAGYNAGKPLQKTILLREGLHAYFNDRWWQQRATLIYFKTLLPGASADATITTEPTVNQTAGGAPAGEQLVDVGPPGGAATPAMADALAAPFICDTTRSSPAFASTP
jgi:predicted alpha/beta-fold hydrolase